MKLLVRISCSLICHTSFFPSDTTCCCIPSHCSEDLFKRVHYEFPILDQVLAEGYSEVEWIPSASTFVGTSGKFLSYEELPPPTKAATLLLILVTSCLDLPSSRYNHLIQDVFGRLVFQGRTSLCSFRVSHKARPSQLSIEASSHLHGKLLSTIMRPQEEAYIRFVIITDICRYHFSALSTICELLKKNPKSCLIDCSLLSDHLLSYHGARCLTKQEKGFRASDISFYQTLKAHVMKERKLMSEGRSSNDIPLNSLTNDQSSTSFIFDYPHSSKDVKVECSLSGSKKKKRKLDSDFAYCEVTNKPIEALAMSLDVDDFIQV